MFKPPPPASKMFFPTPPGLTPMPSRAVFEERDISFCFFTEDGRRLLVAGFVQPTAVGAESTRVG